MILVDTSVWIAAHRGRDQRAAATLDALIDADEALLALPVRIELMAGVAARDRRALRLGLGALPLAMPTEDTWSLLESWLAPAAAAGHRFAVTDLLIAALAAQRGALVWSLDADFARMEALEFVRLFAGSVTAPQ